MVRELRLASFHGTAGDEYGGNVETQGCHQHTGGDLVTVGNADQGVGTMGVDHVLDRIGDDLARGQTVEHAVMAHGNAIVHSNGVEFLGYTTGGFNLAAHQLAQILQVNVTGYELGKGIGDCNDGLLEVLGVHSGGAPKCAGTSHIASLGRGFGSIGRHDASYSSKGS